MSQNNSHLHTADEHAENKQLRERLRRVEDALGLAKRENQSLARQLAAALERLNRGEGAYAPGSPDALASLLRRFGLHEVPSPDPVRLRALERQQERLAAAFAAVRGALSETLPFYAKRLHYVRSHLGMTCTYSDIDHDQGQRARDLLARLHQL